jgi:hypothetical protein
VLDPLTVLGLVRARRGDRDVWPLLDEALGLAEPTGALQRIGPVAAARADAAWLQERHERVATETRGALDLALVRSRPPARWAGDRLGSSRPVHEPPPSVACGGADAAAFGFLIAPTQPRCLGAEPTA